MPKTKNPPNSFKDFTNLYSLSKTLRFELKPLPSTREFLKMDELEKEKLFPKDREKAENYQKLKYYLDLLHREFINGALAKFKEEGESINFKEFFDSASTDSASEVDDNPDTEEKDDYKSIRSKIADKFDDNVYLFDKDVVEELGKNFEEKRGIKFIVRANEPSKEKLPDDAPNIIFTNTEGEKETIFQNFINFTGYLRGFHENRKNLYKDDGKAGRVATRVIDQNLPRFFANIKKFKELLEKHPELLNDFGLQWGDYFSERNKEMKPVFDSFIKQGKNWNNIFQPNYYNHCFLQRDIVFYNYLIRKLNKDINQYGQKLKSEKENKTAKSEEDKASKKASKLPFFEKLHKQILGEVKKKSDFIDVTQETLGNYLKDFRNHSDAKLELSRDILRNIFEDQDMDGIYISNKAINTISSKWFLSWDFFGGKILERQNEGLSESKKRKKIKNFVSLSTVKEVLEGMKESKPSDIFKGEYVSDLKGNNHWENFLDIWRKEWQNILDEYARSKTKLEETIPALPTGKATTHGQKIVIKQFADTSLSIYQMTKYFALLKGVKEIQVDDKNDEFYHEIDLYLFGDPLENDEEKNKENNIYHYYNVFRNFLTKKPWSEDKIKLNFNCPHLLGGWSKKEEKVKLGVILRSNGLYYLAIIHNKNKSVFENNGIFSQNGEFEKMEMMALAWKTLTGKAYKRDFGDKYSSQVFDYKVKQYEDYLSENEVEIKDLENWIKDEDKKKKEDNKYPDDRKVFKKLISFLKKKKDQKDIDLESKIKLGKQIKALADIANMPYTLIVENVQALIQKQYKDDYPILNVFLNRKFESRKEFEEVKDQYAKKIYSVNFDKKISKEQIDKLVTFARDKNPQIQLFQIYNKDFLLDQSLIDVENDGHQRNISGKENIETTLFKMLFHDLNLKNKDGVVLTLNGGAEVFYREPSLKKKHEIRGKRKDGTLKKIERKRRYTKNTIMLHFPITLNFGKPGYFKANDLINEKLQKSEVAKKAKIIGIDRGEKHLAYYTVIDQEENILEQGTLNRIYLKKKDGNSIELYRKQIVLKEDEHGQKRYRLDPTTEKIDYVDYSQVLDCKEKNRILQRKSWDSIEDIKDLKRGYISLVINKLCEIFLKYFEQDNIPPLVVFEKLNIGFKQGRQKIGKQVYQNLELALAKKLGYLTKKFEKEKDQLLSGGVLRALQFVPEIKNYGNDIEKKFQVGVLLYTDPSYTSTTCPSCGFRKRMVKTVFESVKQTKAKLDNHNLEIHHNENKYKFTFTTKQTSKAGQEYSITDTVFSNVSRIYRKLKKNNKGWIADIYPTLTIQIDALFEGRNLDRSQEIFSQIKETGEEDFWKQFMYYFNLILQIRNSSSKKYELSKSGDNLDSEGEDRDFIHCPHCYFHSDNQETWGGLSNRFSSDLIKELKDRGENVFNGDVNGAYNIARKGKLMIDRIKQHPHMIDQFCKRNRIDQKNLRFNNNKFEITEGKGKDRKVIDSISKYPDLLISNTDWDTYVAKGV